MTMKSLLIVRHAKSSWDSPTLKDFDRPLNERGKRDAPAMAARILERGIHPNVFVTSTANRALSTAQAFHEVFKAKKEQLILVPELYHAAPQVFYEVMASLEDDWKTAVIFSHNPGITAFVNSLEVAHVDDMPTCAVFGVQADVKHWQDFAAAAKSFWLFDYPKNV